VPNPFYLKASHGELFSALGVMSVIGYLQANVKLVVLALSSLVPPRLPQQRQRRRCDAPSGLFAVRRIRGVLPSRRYLNGCVLALSLPHHTLSFFLALPCVCFLFEALLKIRTSQPLRLAVTCSVFFVLFFDAPLRAAQTVQQALRGEDPRVRTPKT
jgi:hypothetical protein